MTIAELIDALRAYPLDTPVYIYGRGQDTPEPLKLRAGRDYDYQTNQNRPVLYIED